jgi:hypothetical protein
MTNVLGQINKLSHLAKHRDVMQSSVKMNKPRIERIQRMAGSKAMYRAHSLNSFNSWLIHFLKERLTCGLSPWRGRAHPEHLEPSYYGHSIGHWEGDTIVVDTIGFNEKFWMDREGTPHTEELHLIERFTRNRLQPLKV